MKKADGVNSNPSQDKVRVHTGWIGEGTRRFYREAASTENYTLRDFIHGYIYGRWPYLYIGIGTGEHPLAIAYSKISNLARRLIPWSNQDERKTGSVADNYHGKVIPLEEARRLVSVNEELRVPDLEQVIPYPRARALILKNPDHIVALDCPCRSARSEPCLPLDVCLIIGEPFAGFVRQHHPERSRWISSNEAEKILLEEHERGHAHHAFFKDAMLDRFYAICNCCSCCCGAMQATRNGSPMLASSGYVSRISQDDCIGCGDCESSCPFDAIHLEDGFASILREKCMGCGVCVDICSEEALELELAPDRGIPFEIERLMTMAVDAG
jgi:ferredoxin